MSKLKVARNLDMLKLAADVLKEPQKYGPDLIRRAQAIIEEEKGVKNAVKLDISKYGDTLVTDAPEAKKLGKITVKAAAPAAALVGNPLDMGMQGLGQAADAFDAARTGAIDAVANPIIERLDVRANEQQPSAAPAMRNIVHGAADIALPFAQGGSVPNKYDMSQWQPSVMDQPAVDMSQTAVPQPGMVDSGSQQLAPVSFSDVAQQPVNLQPTPEQQAPAEPELPNVKLPQPQPQQAQQPQPQQANEFTKDVLTHQSRMQAIGRDTEQHYHRLTKEISDISNEIRDGKIDPNAYMNKMSTGEKVGTVIGLMLSGLGSGLSGQPNMAMDFLDKQIDRDIKGQMANLDKKGTLLHALHQQLGSLPQAQQMMKAIAYDQVAGKIAATAAKSNDPQVHARAQSAIAALANQINPAMVQIAQSQAVNQALQSGQITVEQAVPLRVPEHDRAKAYEELGKSREVQQSAAQIEQQMRKLYELTRASSRAKNPIQSAQQINTLQTGLLAIGKPIFGVLSAPEQELLKKAMTPTMFTDKNTLEKNIAIIQQLASKPIPTPVLNSYGLNVPEQQTSKLRPRK